MKKDHQSLFLIMRNFSCLASPKKMTYSTQAFNEPSWVLSSQFFHFLWAKSRDHWINFRIAILGFVEFAFLLMYILLKLLILHLWFSIGSTFQKISLNRVKSIQCFSSPSISYLVGKHCYWTMWRNNWERLGLNLKRHRKVWSDTFDPQGPFILHTYLLS